MSDPSDPNTFRRRLYNLAPTVLRGSAGVRLIGTLGMLIDSFAVAVFDALRAPFHKFANGPAHDALTPLGEEISMPQYSTEGWLQYRARLRTDWETWERAGTRPNIVEQLAFAGYPGASVYVYRPGQFVVFYPAGSHPVTAPALDVGTFTVGPAIVIGPQGITIPEIETLRGLINHWRPARWICGGINFEISGWTIGTGHTVDEPGLTIGGVHATLGV